MVESQSSAALTSANSRLLHALSATCRAYIAIPGVPTLTFIKSGHVSHVDDADYTETSNQPLVALYWESYRDASAGAFQVSKDYEWGGIVGTLRDVVVSPPGCKCMQENSLPAWR